LVPFCPLGRGFLAGGVKRAEDYPEGDTRRIDPRYQGANYEANTQAARVVFDIAAERGATPSQIALAWLLSKGEDIVPIPGTKRRTYLEQNVAAAFVRLEEADVARLDDALVPGNVSGNRYADWILATIDR
jgi:aryl-alcohol dehydrogenase-like predicted oxidoreductase